jgi:hypothetical protein
VQDETGNQNNELITVSVHLMVVSVSFLFQVKYNNKIGYTKFISFPKNSK